MVGLIRCPLPPRPVDATRASCTRRIEMVSGATSPVRYLTCTNSAKCAYEVLDTCPRAGNFMHSRVSPAWRANHLATTLHHPLHPRASIASGSPTAWTASTHHMHMHTPAHNHTQTPWAGRAGAVSVTCNLPEPGFESFLFKLLLAVAVPVRRRSVPLATLTGGA